MDKYYDKRSSMLISYAMLEYKKQNLGKMVVGGDRCHNFLAFNLCWWQDLYCSSARFELLHLCFMVQLPIKPFSPKTKENTVYEKKFEDAPTIVFSTNIINLNRVDTSQLIFNE